MCATVPSSRLSLPVALSSARLARSFLQERWCTGHDSADLAQAQLIVTELVTNAVRHGGPPIELEVECITTDGVMLSVSDGTPERPVAQDDDPTRWGGHGVALVDLLSREWGVHEHGHHRAENGQERGARHRSGTGVEAMTPVKTVWCRLVS